MIEITDIAKDKIKEALNKNPGKYLRILVEGYGWGGPRLGLALDEPEANEAAIPVNGLDVLISDEVKSLAESSTLDYINESYREGFTIRKAGFAGCWKELIISF
jgi:Fe-S cluster assembly iron-binding protein IscA